MSITGRADIVGVQWSDGTVVRINDVTGKGTLIGPSGFLFLNSLAKDHLGRLYTVTDAFPSSATATLLTIDLVTGKGTAVATIHLGDGIVDIRALAFSPQGVLFAINQPNVAPFTIIKPFQLWTIDVHTGEGTLVGDVGADQALEFSPEGTLYGWEVRNLLGNGLDLLPQK